MPSSPLDGKHDRTTLGVACHHRLRAAYTVERRREWQHITALDSTHGRTTSGVVCHHSLWVAHTVERHWAWHSIIALGRQTRLNKFERCKPSAPLENIDDQTMSGVACHHGPRTTHTAERCWALHAIIALGQHTRSDDNERGMISQSLDSTHGQTTSGVACHHRL